MIHVISLGAGVQSSVMALMAAHGEITPMPQVAIFADTGWEPRAVYTWLDWLETRLPFPVVRVSAGNIREDQQNQRRSPGKSFTKGERLRWASMPFFVGGNGERAGMTVRQCTSEYKIEPIEKYLRREVMGLAYRQRAPKEVVITQWRGISADEASRMKASRVKWYETRFPLAMEHRMTRRDCYAWMAKHDYPEPSRSACIGCPYHSDIEWRNIRDNSPEEWEEAVAFDDAIRWAGGMTRPTFLHRQCVPLAEVDLRTAEDHGQASLFGNECEGMCGL